MVPTGSNLRFSKSASMCFSDGSEGSQQFSLLILADRRSISWTRPAGWLHHVMLRMVGLYMRYVYVMMRGGRRSEDALAT